MVGAAHARRGGARTPPRVARGVSPPRPRLSLARQTKPQPQHRCARVRAVAATPEVPLARKQGQPGRARRRARCRADPPHSAPAYPPPRARVRRRSSPIYPISPPRRAAAGGGAVGEGGGKMMGERGGGGQERRVWQVVVVGGWCGGGVVRTVHQEEQDRGWGGGRGAPTAIAARKLGRGGGERRDRGEVEWMALVDATEMPRQRAPPNGEGRRGGGREGEGGRGVGRAERCGGGGGAPTIDRVGRWAVWVAVGVWGLSFGRGALGGVRAYPSGWWLRPPRPVGGGA